MKSRLLLLATTLCLLAPGAFAQSKVPSLINYQGNVRTAAGVAIGAGTAVNRTVTFRFYKNPTSVLAADRLWSESQTATILDGNFNVLIGNGAAVSGETNAVTPFANVFSQSSAVYLGITVDDGNAATVDAEISPRQQLVTGAFAFRSTVAESVDNLAITSSMLSSGAVTTNQLGAAAVTTAKIANDAVTGLQILNGTIQETKLANGSVTSAKILDGTIVSADIAADTITAGNIAPGAVASSEILDASITGADLANTTIPLSALVAAVQEALVPAGTVVAYGGGTAPAGWLLCDGTSYVRTDYPNLFNAISTSFGTASTTTFNVPDLRGRFIRGWNSLASGLARDPNPTTRTAMATGGAVGNLVGSMQLDELKAHSHVTSYTTTGYGASYNNGAEALSNSRNNGGTTRTSSTVGGSETRPVNVYMNYIIKR